jgi:hypothetical protein
MSSLLFALTFLLRIFAGSVNRPDLVVRLAICKSWDPNALEL